MKRFIIFSIFLIILLLAARFLEGSEFDKTSGSGDERNSFSEDGRDVYWSRARIGVMNCSLSDDGWSEPVPVEFGVEFPGPGCEVHNEQR
jgi:hypothetical protein